MKRAILAELMLVYLCCSIAHAGDYIRLGSDSVIANTDDFDLVFHIERTCAEPIWILGASNSFVMTATGDASWTWKNQYQDSNSSVNWNLAMQFYLVDNDGVSPDSFVAAGASMPSAGLPIITDEPYFHIILDIGGGLGEICIDSAYIPPQYAWFWSSLTCGEGGSPERPLFVDALGSDDNHPICITVGEPSCNPPTINVTPPGGQLATNHCGSTSFTFGADPGDQGSVPATPLNWSILSGPGSIDPATGNYCATCSTEGTYPVTVSATNSCGESDDFSFNLVCTNACPYFVNCSSVPDTACCGITYTFDFDADDLDSCGALTYTIVSVEPASMETPTIDDNGLFQWMLDCTEVGRFYTVRVAVWDSEGKADTCWFYVTVVDCGSGDPGIRDTLCLGKISVEASATDPVSIGVPARMFNDQELCAGSYGFYYDSDDIEADSVCWLGGAASHLSTLIADIDTAANTILIGFMRVDEPTGIVPGDSLLATLWFTLSPGAPAQEAIIDSTFVPPSGVFQSIPCDRGRYLQPWWCPGCLFISIFPAYNCGDSEFRPDENGYQFANVKEEVWPEEAHEFYYCGSSDRYNILWPTYIAWCVRHLPNSFPPWDRFVDCFGIEQCYILDGGGTPSARREVAVENWDCILNALRSPMDGETWHGSCAGFSGSSLLFYNEPSLFSEIFPGHSRLFDVVAGSPDYARKTVNKYYVYQFGQEQLDWVDYNCFTSPKTAPDALEDIKNMLASPGENDAELVIHNNWALASGSKVGHGFVPFKCVREVCDPRIWRIFVYDGNYPGDNTKSIKVDMRIPSWVYWDYCPEPYSFFCQWGGPVGMFLMDPIENYMNTPVMTPLRDRELFASRFTPDSLSAKIRICMGAADSIELTCSEGSIGRYGAEAFRTVSEGSEITPRSNYEGRPIGYYLNNGEWACTFSDFLDTTFYMVVFTDHTLLKYFREGDVMGNAENLYYPGDDSTLWVRETTSMPETFRYGIKTVSPYPDSEVVVSIENIEPALCDSARYQVTPGLGIRGDIFSGVSDDLSFDLRIRIASQEGDTVFYHQGVSATAASAFEIVPDWRPFGDSVMILVGPDAMGALTDTVFAANQTEQLYLCGDATGSGTIDIDDVVFLIAYIFSGGPAPVPVAAGDADCSDGSVDIDDVVYLINYIFSGGSEPCDTDGDGEPDC